MRADHHYKELLCPEGIPRKASPDPVLRQGQQQASGLPDQQLIPAGTDHCRTVSLPMADKAVLQVDQAASQNQGILWYHRECDEDPDLDRHLGVCACGDREENSENRQQPLHNSTDFECYFVREDAHSTSICGFKLSGFKVNARQPVDFIRLTLGQ